MTKKGISRLITVQQLDAAIEEGIPYEYTPWRATESVPAAIEGSEFWHEGYEHGPFVVEGLGTLSYVTGEHGGEGSAEYIWQVWSVVNLDTDEIQYFKKDGYYASYDGSNWDGEIYEVEPFEKTVTDWRLKK